MNLQTRVSTWHTAQFPRAQREHVVLKGVEEMGEVASAIIADASPEFGGHPGSVPAEAADVVIVMMALLGRWYPDVDLLSEVTKKLDTLSSQPAQIVRTGA